MSLRLSSSVEAFPSRLRRNHRPGLALQESASFLQNPTDIVSRVRYFHIHTRSVYRSSIRLSTNDRNFKRRCCDASVDHRQTAGALRRYSSTIGNYSAPLSALNAIILEITYQHGVAVRQDQLEKSSPQLANKSSRALFSLPAVRRPCFLTFAQFPWKLL